MAVPRSNHVRLLNQEAPDVKFGPSGLLHQLVMALSGGRIRRRTTTTMEHGKGDPECKLTDCRDPLGGCETRKHASKGSMKDTKSFQQLGLPKISLRLSPPHRPPPPPPLSAHPNARPQYRVLYDIHPKAHDKPTVDYNEVVLLVRRLRSVGRRISIEPEPSSSTTGSTVRNVDAADDSVGREVSSPLKPRSSDRRMGPQVPTLDDLFRSRSAEQASHPQVALSQRVSTVLFLPRRALSSKWPSIRTAKTTTSSSVFLMLERRGWITNG
ncbi:hypothetical protein BKA80DRAFT_253512 [Phyllosticta citrichinensis]